MPRIHSKTAAKSETRYQTANRLIAERPIPDPPGAKRPARRSVTVNLAESPLAWLYSRGHLSQRHYDAGERLRLDYEKAGLGPSVTMRWDAGIDRGVRAVHALDRTAAQAEAKRRFDAALAKAGTGLDAILWRVVCAGENVPMAERALGWPVRAGKLVLALALDRVADYYRIA